MLCVYVISEDSGPSFRREFDITGDRDDGFRETVDDNEESVAPIQGRESGDHVHRNVGPRSFGDSVRIERGRFRLRARLRALADFAALT